MNSSHPAYSIFLPVRAGSQRVPGKNTRSFAGIEGGLVELKLKQLALLPGNYEIILSTDDPVAMEIGRSSAYRDRVKVEERPAWLCTSEVPLRELVLHVPTVCSADLIIWTHVTSPFFDMARVTGAVSEFHKRRDEGYDSLMSVTKVQKYLWDAKEGKSVNYDHSQGPWPSTQTLPLWYEVNSGIFIAHRSAYEINADRIGNKPLCWENDWLSSVDVDWQEDFELAQVLYKNIYADKL